MTLIPNTLLLPALCFILGVALGIRLERKHAALPPRTRAMRDRRPTRRPLTRRRYRWRARPRVRRDDYYRWEEFDRQ